MTEDDWRTPATTSGDQEEIHPLIRYFDAFTSGSGTDERMAVPRDAMLPEATVVRRCGLSPVVDDVDAFIEPRRAMLADFRGEPGPGRLDLFGDIAQWFGRVLKGGPHERRSPTPVVG